MTLFDWLFGRLFYDSCEAGCCLSQEFHDISLEWLDSKHDLESAMARKALAEANLTIAQAILDRLQREYEVYPSC